MFGGDLSTPVRLAYGLVPLVQLLETRGHAAQPLLAAAEIPGFALEEPSYRISLQQELTFTRRALARLGGDVALEVGRRFHLSMFGVLGLAASCAPTLHESFRLLLAYPALVWGLIEVTVWRDDAGEYVVFVPGDVVGDLGDYFVARDMAALVTLFSNTLGEATVPTALRLRRPAPSNARVYDAFFGCEVTFGAAENSLYLTHALWRRVPPQANEMSRRFFENQCRDLSEQMRTPFRFADIVRGRLRHAVPIPGLPALADDLHLTPRTLQRRLAAEGENFGAILREVRASKAMELLERPGIAIADVSFRLGFREPDAFSRAFRSWTGVAPTEYRRARQS